MRLKIFLVALILSLPFWWGINAFQENLESAFYAQISQPIQEISLVKIPPQPKKPELELQARAAISSKVNGSEKILFKENINQPLPIASLTKLMTAVVVLENTPNDDYNLSKVITISKKAATQEDVPVFGNLEVGDNLLLERILELMLIYSSNDAAFALSEIIGHDYFVEKMNQKAKEIGLENTQFLNPTGLDPEGIHYEPANLDYFNYSTTNDLAKLAQYILKDYPAIFNISSSQGPYPPENGTSDLVIPDDFKILGGKTGYTDEAGGCMLLTLENKKGNKIINAILGTPSAETRITEMQKLIDWLLI